MRQKSNLIIWREKMNVIIRKFIIIFVRNKPKIIGKFRVLLFLQFSDFS